MVTQAINVFAPQSIQCPLTSFMLATACLPGLCRNQLLTLKVIKICHKSYICNIALLFATAHTRAVSETAALAECGMQADSLYTSVLFVQQPFDKLHACDRMHIGALL